MVIIKRLQIEAFRNLNTVYLEPVPGLNRLIGPNGSGKTSLLEAIHYLATGRSFRGAGSSRLRQEHCEEALLFSEICNLSCHRLGVRLLSKGREFRINGRATSRFEDLAGRLKTVLYTPEGHQLVCGGPKERRRFLDWGLFHMEPAYLELARRYNRILQQRNQWLKTSGIGNDPWAVELAQTGEEISRQREHYVDRLAQQAEALFAELQGFGDLEIHLRRGWSKNRSLKGALEWDWARGSETTRVGPHRGDLLLTLDGGIVRERASRGQQKVVVLALRLAQLALVAEETGEPPIFLFDDVTSELDGDRREAALALLERFGEQVFLTSTEETLCPLPRAGAPAATFQVNAGVIERRN